MFYLPYLDLLYSAVECSHQKNLIKLCCLLYHPEVYSMVIWSFNNISAEVLMYSNGCICCDIQRAAAGRTRGDCSMI